MVRLHALPHGLAVGENLFASAGGADLGIDLFSRADADLPNLRITDAHAVSSLVGLQNDIADAIKHALVIWPTELGDAFEE